MKEVDQAHPVYFANNQFATDFIQFYYPITATDQLAEQALLPALLMKTNQLYPEEDQMQKECIRRYILSMYARMVTIGTQLFYCFGLEIPKKTMISEVQLLDCFQFFKNTISCPNVQDGNFPKFEQEKQRVLFQLKNKKKNKYGYTYHQVMKQLDPDGFLCQKIEYHEEELKRVTSKQVYDFYVATIQKQTPFIFLFGSEKLKTLIPILEKTWDFSKYRPSLLLNCNQFLERKPLEQIEEKKPFRESILTLAYQVKEMTEEDRFPLMVLNQILSSSATQVLMQELREEAKLVYAAGSTSFSHFGLLLITCEIAAVSKEEATKRIQQVVTNLKDSQLLEEKLALIKKRYYVDLLRKMDQKGSIFNDFVDQYFGIEKTLEEEEAMIATMQVETLIGLLERLSLRLVYFLKGVQNEK